MNRLEIDRKAKSILIENDRGGYTVPTKGLYPYQWNWDSAFVALGFAQFDRARAWAEIDTLFKAQWSDGFVPHIVFHVDEPTYFPGPSVWRTGKHPQTSGISQPPVAASIVRWLYEDGGAREREQIAALFPKLLAWHRWFKTYRDADDNGLVICTHPWESGRDNSPEWDAPSSSIDTSGVEPYQRRDLALIDHDMRPSMTDYDRYIALLQFGRDHNWDHKVIAQKGPFRVFDVGLTMILLRANKDLAFLASALNEQTALNEINGWIRAAEAGVDNLWNDEVGAYCSKDQITNQSSSMVTSASFLSFYAGVGSDKQKRTLIENLNRIAKSVTYMLPSFDPANESFNSILYWRGPVWAVVNRMVSLGLEENGYQELSARIKADTLALIEKSGFHEAYCPLSAKGTGGSEFSWTAAMWLDLNRRDGEPSQIEGAA